MILCDSFFHGSSSPKLLIFLVHHFEFYIKKIGEDIRISHSQSSSSVNDIGAKWEKIKIKVFSSLEVVSHVVEEYSHYVLEKKLLHMQKSTLS